MADPAPVADLDVFLSYKREEKEVATALAKFLITRGYDVWWDDALLAGENFAEIVHAELKKSRAVVVLWSKQSRISHWVRAEAQLAFEHGTLINTIIDSLPFEGIPPEFSNIQAVRLDDDAVAFHEAVAAAIARKGANPLLAQRSPSDAGNRLAGKARDTEFFSVIANSTHLADFEEYLAMFGEAGQFANLARRRITALQQAAAERKSLWRLARYGIVGTVGFLASLTAIVTFWNTYIAAPAPPAVIEQAAAEPVAATPDPQPAPTPDPIPVTTAPELSPLDFDFSNPDSLFTRQSSEPGSQADALVRQDVIRTILGGPRAGLTITRPDGGSETLPEAHPSWQASSDSLSASYSAGFTLDGGLPADIHFTRFALFSATIGVNLAADPADPLLGGATRITSVSADGTALPGTPATSGPSFTFDDPGRLFGVSLDSLATAASIAISLAYADGRTAILTLTQVPDAEAMRKVVKPARSMTFIDELGGATPSTAP